MLFATAGAMLLVILACVTILTVIHTWGHVSDSELWKSQEFDRGRVSGHNDGYAKGYGSGAQEAYDKLWAQLLDRASNETKSLVYHRRVAGFYANQDRDDMTTIPKTSAKTRRGATK